MPLLELHTAGPPQCGQRIEIAPRFIPFSFPLNPERAACFGPRPRLPLTVAENLSAVRLQHHLESDIPTDERSGLADRDRFRVTSPVTDPSRASYFPTDSRPAQVRPPLLLACWQYSGEQP